MIWKKKEEKSHLFWRPTKEIKTVVIKSLASFTLVVERKNKDVKHYRHIFKFSFLTKHRHL